MDAKITITFITAVNGVQIVDSASILKSEQYADSVDARKMIDDILQDGIWQSMSDEVRYFIPPKSIIGFLVQDIIEEEGEE
jgi:hypothetical protein